MQDPTRARLIDMPPAAADRIDRLYVWIMTNEDGGEGMVSADMDIAGDGTVRHMPLLTSRRESAERMRPLAETIRGETQRRTGRKVTISLRSFVPGQP